MKLSRQPYVCRTSFPLEELEVTLADGAEVQLILKIVDRRALSHNARRAKLTFLHDPLREMRVYQKILQPKALGTALYYGAVQIDAGTPSCDGTAQIDPGRSWLFLERVVGRELFQIGELEIWEATARWLARFHTRLSVSINETDDLHLIEYNGDFYRIWMRRAVAFCRDPAAKIRLEWIAARYDCVIDRLLALPVTMLHAEFYASNILVQETHKGLRICPVDWEMAARGPGPIDLAALIAGKWTDAERLRMASAYYDELAAPRSPAPVPVEIIDDCRLHLAIQWLGWSPNWSPPPEHRHDWLGEALMLAERRLH